MGSDLPHTPPPKVDPERAIVTPEGAGPESISEEEMTNFLTMESGVPSVQGGVVGGGESGKAKMDSSVARGGEGSHIAFRRITNSKWGRNNNHGCRLFG